MKSKRFRSYLPVLLIYCGFVIIRFIFSCLTTAMPTVGIDEFLYYSLGRSIATEGRLLFRGQPALYNYFIYPLFLSPVYMIFPEGADFYRIIQCWNAILMNLGVFPIYALCRKTLRNDKRALWVSALFLLFPDFSLSEFIFSEAVIYPLFFWLVYLIYLQLEEKKLSRFIGIGILGAVLYYTKPGAVVPAVVSLLFFLIHGLVRKERRETIGSLCGLGCFAGSYVVLWAVVHFIFGYSGALFSIYHEQLNTEGTIPWDSLLRIAACYPYYFCMACGVVPAVMAVARIKYCGQKARIFYRLLVACLGIMMLGTTWTINRSEYTSVLFLRYIAMYVPLVFLGCLMPEEQRDPALEGEKKRRLSVLAILLCVYMVICTAVWGSTIGATTYVNNHFIVSLAILVQPNIMGTANIIIFLLAGFSLFLLARRFSGQRTAAICTAVFAAMMIVNNAGGYIATGSNAVQPYRTEAMNAQHDLIRGEEYLYLFSSEKMSSDHGLNIYTKNNNQHLEWYDFFNNIHAHGGAYAPFVPVSERGMNEGGETPDVNLLVAEETTYPLIKFSENIQGTYTEEGSFYIGRFESGARIIDAMIANMENFKLLQSDYGVLTIYREDWINHPVKISLTIESPVVQNMRFFADDAHSWTVELQAGTYGYEFQLSNAAIGYNFVVDRADIMVYRFDIEAMEE